MSGAGYSAFGVGLEIINERSEFWQNLGYLRVIDKSRSSSEQIDLERRSCHPCDPTRPVSPAIGRLVRHVDDNLANVFSALNPPIRLAIFSKGINPIDHRFYFVHCHRIDQGFEIRPGANG